MGGIMANLKVVVFNLVLAISESKTEISNKEAYNNLKCTISSIKQSCGEVCNLSIKGNVYSKSFTIPSKFMSL